MRKTLCIVILSLLTGWGSALADTPAREYHKVNPGHRPSDISKYSLWYDIPAASTGVSDTWMEYALPLGNGQLGATFRGNILKDELQFNEKTLWSGYTTNGSANGQGYFQNLGSIVVTDLSGTFSLNDDGRPVNDYQRYLDIVNGVGGVNYKSSDNRTQYTRRYFTSATDKVFVGRYESAGTDKLALCFAFNPDKVVGSAVTYTPTGAGYGKKLEVVSYHTAFDIQSDGKVERTDQGIKVTDATWAQVIMAAATDYDATKSGCVSGKASELPNVVNQRIANARSIKYKKLLARHVARHSALMNRVRLDIGGASDMTTENLIKAYNTSAANKLNADGKFLETLYFQYGRYLTIGANMDSDIHAPSNLQGIWNDRSNSDFWHCDVHADINVEMNYWPADPTNLSEMHLPFVEHIVDLAGAEGSPWKAFAAKIGGKHPDGWTVACENNIFGGTSTWMNRSMKTLGSWYVSHLWRYYRYSADKQFLKRALPIMLANARYTMDIAKDDPAYVDNAGYGRKVIMDEWSPEHGPYGPNAFAQQTASEAIANTIAAHEALGTESTVSQADIDALMHFYEDFDKGIHIEKYTWKRDGRQYTDMPCLSEWLHSPLEDPGHRHLSHLMCVYPFAQITAYGTTQQDKDNFEAAKNAILARNGDVTGWSMGWQTNVYARLLQGDNSRSYLSKALKHSTSYTIAMGGQGGCYYNLFDAHSPFQIDGNYGCTSGVAEMLLQSYDGVALLPALPTAWSAGQVDGLKAEGNFTISMKWADGHLLSASIVSNAGGKLRLQGTAATSLKDLKVKKGCKTVGKLQGSVYEVDTRKGDKLTIQCSSKDI